ncbi:unnamed protein product [Prorocentrum cordatum]|uniref:Uncharacterized protein n=1 Tax=Prorocentrum cordatum TaxID=2364126 RepID=A0ABN9Q6H1_9DINO|nr:unnamed protein product [Polarella glacialis]
MALLEQSAGDAVAKHQAVLEELRSVSASSGEQGRTLQDHLTSHEKHSKELANQRDRHTAVAERVALLEQWTGNCAVKYDMVLEELRSVGESTDKHSRVLNGILTRHDRHAKDLVDHYDRHAKRVAFLQQWPVKQAPKHGTVWDELRSVGDLQRSHARHVGDSQERLQSIEEERGTDRHTKALDDLRRVHEGYGGHVSELRSAMEERLSCLEKQIGDSADRSASALADLWAQHEELRASHGQLSSLPERVARLEGRLRSTRSALRAALEQQAAVPAVAQAADARRLEEHLPHCEGTARQELADSAQRGDRLAAAASRQDVTRRTALVADEHQRPGSPELSLPRTPLADKLGGGRLAAPPTTLEPAPKSGADLAALAGRPGLPSPNRRAAPGHEALARGGATVHEPVVLGEVP